MYSPLQEQIWANKLAKKFNTTDVPMELCLLQAELAEFFKACEGKSKSSPGEELADVMIFAHGLARMVEVALPPLPLTSVSELKPPTPTGLPVKISDFFEAWKRGHSYLFPKLLEAIVAEIEALAYGRGIAIVREVEAKVEINGKRHYVATARGHVQSQENIHPPLEHS